MTALHARSTPFSIPVPGASPRADECRAVGPKRGRGSPPRPGRFASTGLRQPVRHARLHPRSSIACQAGGAKVECPTANATNLPRRPTLSRRARGPLSRVHAATHGDGRVKDLVFYGGCRGISQQRGLRPQPKRRVLPGCRRGGGKPGTLGGDGGGPASRGVAPGLRMLRRWRKRTTGASGGIRGSIDIRNVPCQARTAISA